jgi:hypothetical protein
MGTVRTCGGAHEAMTKTVHEHRVGFFADDERLAVEAGRFVRAGLDEGTGVLVIATPPHRALIDAEAGSSADGYVSLDADSTLRSLLVDGQPDLDLLLASLGDLIAGLRARGGRVQAYGEMVARLWQRGDVEGAIALEALWNDLARELDLDLLCGYPAEILGDAELPQLRAMCREHNALVTPDASSPAAQGAYADDVHSRSRVFLPAPQAVSATRHFVADVLAEWGQSPLVEDCVLIASELATNAVVHGGSPFRASVRREAHSVLIEVEDADAATPYRGPALLDAVDGRGIAIVEDLAHRSGCRRLADSKVLWAELAAG